MFYIFDKNGNFVPGYDDCNGGFPTIDAAIFFCGENDNIVDENGIVVWTWEIWMQEAKAK